MTGTHISIVLPIAIWKKEIKQKNIHISGLKLPGRDVQELFALKLGCTVHARRGRASAPHLQMQKMVSLETERISGL